MENNQIQYKYSKVIILGAGLSGICQAIKLQENKINDYIIFEKNSELGGTWLDNKYPGCSCDTPSHQYCYSFEQNPKWTRRWTSHSEILEYIKNVVKKYNIRPNIVFNTWITQCEYIEEECCWKVSTLQVPSKEITFYKSKYLVLAPGGLSTPLTPQLKNQELFQGKTMHTAKWDSSYSLDNKKVAVIGSAASAVQLVPNIIDKVQELKLFQRTPNYHLDSRIKNRNGEIHWIIIFLFTYVPFLLRIFRWILWMSEELKYLLLFKWRYTNKLFAKLFIRDMKRIVKNKNLHEKLTPKYELGCKRILVTGPEFYECFNKQNFELIDTNIQEFTANGIKTTDNREFQFDLIIYATGYVTNSADKKQIIFGKNNQFLFPDKVSREAYKNSFVPNAPNLFLLTGPNSGLGHSSMIFIIETMTNYTTKCIKYVEDNKFDSIEAKADKCKEFNVQIQKDMKNSIFKSGCKSWYQNQEGTVYSLYPRSTVRFWWIHQFINFKEEFILFKKQNKKIQ